MSGDTPGKKRPKHKPGHCRRPIEGMQYAARTMRRGVLRMMEERGERPPAEFKSEAETAPLPANYEAACAALAECSRIDECQSWADKARAMASYARQAEDDRLFAYARRIQARALSRAGELLQQVEPARGGDRGGGRGNQGDGTVPMVSRKAAASAAGMSERQAKNAMRIASIPEPEFERLVEQEHPPSATELAEIGKKPRRPEKTIDMRGGRSSEAFQRCLHFTATLERFAREISAYDIAQVTSELDDDERARTRQAVERLDGVLDQIVTRI